jgi:hypothetical protein
MKLPNWRSGDRNEIFKQAQEIEYNEGRDINLIKKTISKYLNVFNHLLTQI